MDFCVNQYKKEQEAKATRSYFAECIRLVAENTAKIVSGEYIKARLSDVLEPKPADKRTSAEIISSIRAKLAE